MKIWEESDHIIPVRKTLPVTPVWRMVGSRQPGHREASGKAAGSNSGSVRWIHEPVGAVNKADAIPVPVKLEEYW